jgi:FAD/FMN-containing dehydrogenase
MNSVRYQPDSHTVVAAGGVRNQDAAAVLRSVNVTIPSGQCPTVGVAGLTLGGGLGMSARSLGMTSDSLLSTEVVLANGDIVTASTTQNSDLFWALRGGGGGNFGINTGFTYAAHPARNCTHFSVDFPADRTAQVLDAWFTVLTHAPRELGMVWYHIPGATPADKPFCGTWGQLYGSEEETRDTLAPVIAAGGPPILAEFIEGSYWEATQYLAENDPTPHGFLCRSRFLDQQPRNGGATSIFAWGGAIADISPTATAFVHRGATALISYCPQWHPDDSATRDASSHWLNETYEVMEPYSSRRSFQNFPDGSLVDWQRAYYGENLERLVGVKQKYDPNRIFAFPQAIPNA